MAIDREKVLVAAQKLVEKRKYDRAIFEYQKLVQEDPNDARTLLKIGDLQSKLELYADAVATYERVGRYYAQQGFALKAIAVYKQIRDIIARHVPQLDDLYAHIPPKLAELYQQLGLISDALAALDEVATRHLRQGRDAEAIQVFRKIVELDPTNPLPHLRLAEALSRARDVDGAVSAFGIAAGQLVKLGRRDDALKVLERLLHHRADPTHARIAAELYLARGGPNDGLQALAKLQICFQANPMDLDTLNLLARAFNAIGQAAKAIEVQKEMARIAREQGRRELFKSLVTKLQRLAPNDEAVHQLMALDSAPPPRPRASSIPAPAEEPSESSDLAYQQVRDSEIETEELLAPAPARESSSVVEEIEPSFVEEVDTDRIDTPAIAADGRELVARALADANAFRRARVYDRALATLRTARVHAPRSLELSAALRDVLLEIGHHQDAVTEMLHLASLQIDALDGDGAAQTLHDILAIDPTNARAIEMLRELGYEVVEEQQVLAGRPTYSSVAGYDGGAPLTADAPLPSYDLEEIGPEDVAPAAYAESSIPPSYAPPPVMRLDEIDEPFESPPVRSRRDVAPISQDIPLEARPPIDVTVPASVPPASGSASARATGPASQSVSGGAATTADADADLEEALEEAEFFASRGLFDDARTILEEQLGRLPNHPLLRERLSEIDAQVRSIQGGSGTRVVPRDPPAPPPSAPRKSAPPHPVDRSFDIAATLGALEEHDESNGALQAAVASLGDIDVEEVFAKFKEGVSKNIAVDDAQSHYDLGLAYKEMGLLDDSIRELETAANDPKRACVCLSMIGMIEMERGNVAAAIEAFLRGLQAPQRTPEQEMVLSFELGAAYEAQKMPSEALNCYQRVLRRDPSYRDVQERVRRLSRPDTAPPIRAAAVGADDDFDRAFDDIFGGGKLP